MTPPVPREYVLIQARVRVFSRGGTLLGTFAGIDLRWSNGKDNGALSFTAHTLEEDYAFDVFDDTVGVVQVKVGDGEFVESGPPYLLTSRGTVVGAGEQAAKTVQVTGVSGLALLSEWQVLHFPDADGLGTVNRRGPDVLFYGWQHPDGDFGSLTEGTIVRTTRASIATDAARRDQPEDWEVAGADWVNIEESTGALNLFRLGGVEDATVTATIPTKQLVRFATAADEEHTLYLYKEGYGGVAIQATQQETGYKYRVTFDEVLDPGELFLSLEMTTVNSEGGDGLDAFAYYVAKLRSDDTIDPDNVYAHSGAGSISGVRIPKDDARPGFTVGRLLKNFRDQNRLWMGGSLAPSLPSAQSVSIDFTAALDSDGVSWPDVHERSWAFGTPISQVVADLGDVADFDMSFGKVLKAYVDKGQDRSATVKLLPGSEPGGNLLSYTWQTRPITATRVTFKTEDGFGQKVDSDLEESVGPRSVFLESQQSSSIGEARRLGQRYVDDNGAVRKVYDAQWVPEDGTVPGVDVDWGDTVQGLNRVGNAVNVRMITWAVTRDGTNGPLIASAELQ